MKWIFSIFLAFSFNAMAQEDYNTQSDIGMSFISSVNVNNCFSWTSIQSDRGGFGYACSSYPSSVQVPDYYSTQQAIRELENKISQLEARIQQLESK